MAVVVSAPGKVLITGGYLVLEQPHSGLVLSTSARFYAILKPLYDTSERNSWAWSWTDVKVLSPQLSKEATYKLSLRNFILQKVSPLSDGGNAFVEHAIQLAVASAKLIHQENEDLHDAFQNCLLKGLEITILGSNEFYSYRKVIEAKCLPLLSESLALLPPFTKITLNTINNEERSDGSLSTDSLLPEVAKTGLGSSAAMTSAVAACVLQYLGAVKLPCGIGMGIWGPEMQKDLDIVHAVSQAAHCIAQGKIGSGFDVSAAIYGSQHYVRFSPSILSHAQASNDHLVAVEVASKLLKEKWDGERLEYALPPLLALVVGEPGSGGSHTPSMVGAVQTWRKKDPQKAQIIWSELAQANLDVEKGLLQLKQIAHLQEENYRHTIESCKKLAVEQWPHMEGDTNVSHVVVKSLLATREAFLKVRSLLRQMGDGAGVPIEPASQTVLLDATMNMKGVLLAGVPGAGGYDAVFAITLGSSVRDHVEREWSQRGVLSLCVVEDPKGVQLEEKDPRNDPATSMGALRLT